MPSQPHTPLAFLPSNKTECVREAPFVAVIRSVAELRQVLRAPSPNLLWLQIEDLLEVAEAWALAAQGADEIPFDVLVTAPEREFSMLYRLADVRTVRDVRVTIPGKSGLFRAVRLAASLGLPIRLLPGQPSGEVLEELEATLDMYLHDPVVEAPIEFFHSGLAWARGAEAGSLWNIMEEDPALFWQSGDRSGLLRSAQQLNRGGMAKNFVSEHLAGLIARGAECATCPWQQLCQGYFKWPSSAYSCHGVKRLFQNLHEAAEEIGQDLGQQAAGSDSRGH